MKSLNYIWMLCLVLASTVCFTACDDDDEAGASGPMTISQIYLQDADATVPDRPVEFARLGQLIRIEGSGFAGLKKVYINGYETFFNNALVTDNNIWVTLHANTPVAEADPEVRNTIRLVKGGDSELTYEFIIRAASPQITSVDNTLPVAGEVVKVNGLNLQETTKVTLPGGIEVASGIESDPDGEWYTFTMPAGVTEGGAITSEGANGTAITPAYFNENRCYVLNFDDKGVQGSWSWDEGKSMCDAEHDVVADPLGGRGNCAMLVPQRMLDAGGAISGKSRVSEWWTAGNDEPTDDWSRMFDVIPATTPVSEVAFQFDIYVPEAWAGTGHIQLSLFNNFNISGIGSDDDGAQNAVAFSVPWIQDGAQVPFVTEGWQTITIPFSQFNKYATLIEDGEAPTFQMVVDDRNAASYRNFGIGFVNTDFIWKGVEVVSTLFNQKIYLDNWRVVPCKGQIVSDYPDEEEAE